MLGLSRWIHPIELGPVLVERYDRVAIKNSQKHCLTPSERGDRSIQSGRCWEILKILTKSHWFYIGFHWFYIGFGKDFPYFPKILTSPTLNGPISELRWS